MSYLPPDPAGPSIVPPSPAAVITLTHLSVPVIIVLVAATVIVSVATTLVTLSFARRRDRRLLATGEAGLGMPIPACSPEDPTGQGDILLSHPGRSG